ncbi:MAG: M24 family metallopeptidase [Bacteroidetes bacterium]|nr:MAG: M24 family metallopeptidase [Bacteroidota bacterium]
MKKIILLPLILLFVCHSGFSQQVELPTDYLSAEFHRGRRDALRKLLPPNTVAVLFANPVRNRANDVDYVYHQDPDFYYLTGYNEPNAVLLLFSEPQQDGQGNSFDEIIFVQPRDPYSEMWNGRRLGVEGVKQQLGFSQVYENTDFKDFNMNFGSFDKVYFYDFHNDVRDSKRNTGDLYDLIAGFKQKANYPSDYDASKYQVYDIIRSTDIENKANVAQEIGRITRFNPALNDDPIVLRYKDAGNEHALKKVQEEVPHSNLDGYSLNYMMANLREGKLPEELKLLKKAVEISCVGQIEVMKAMHPGMSESEIQGIHEFVFKKYGAEYEGYPSIVGSGHNGCILHYIENNRPEVGGDLVLMDLGAEYHGYTADVTRTIPADGTFTPEQKAIYDLVYEAQEAAFKECRVGNPFWAPHRAAQKVIDEGLARLGIIKPGQRHNYFPHGTSHYLGLDVHDKGTRGAFKPNTVITVEPGIYIPHNSDCDPKWWGIAVRIEDDVLITEEGWVNLSAMAPRKSEEIEALMAQPSALDDFKLPDLE